MLALFGSVVLAAVGVAIDLTRLNNIKGDLQDMADAAALAAAHIAADKDTQYDREKVIAEALAGSGYYEIQGFIPGEPDFHFNDTTSRVDLKLTGELDTFLVGYIGVNSFSPTVNSVAAYPVVDVTPISIAFVLDVSGSMGVPIGGSGQLKIEALKDAVKVMFTALEEGVERADILKTTIRTGMVAYSDKIEVSKGYPIDYGWDGLINMVDTLSATGGTNIAPAIVAGHDMLKNDTVKPDGLKQFVVLMTDGANSIAGADLVQMDEDTAAACMAVREDGMEVFSISFDAQMRGRLVLVDCATFDDGRDTGDNNILPPGWMTSPLLKAALDTCSGITDDGFIAGLCRQLEDYIDGLMPEKSDYYFEAEDATALKAAFKEIGESLANIETRIVN